MIFTASIECVASAYYLTCEYSRLSFAPLLRFARMRGGCIRRLHNCCLYSSFFFFVEEKQLLPLLCQSRLDLFRLQRFGTRNKNKNKNNNNNNNSNDNKNKNKNKNTPTKNRDQIFLIDIFLQIMQISRLTKVCSAPRQDDGVFEVW